VRASQSQAGKDEPLPLPRLRAPMAPERLVAVLDDAAKRGKLPEFEPGGSPSLRRGRVGGEVRANGVDGAPLFSMLAYGTPWDADLVGEVEPAEEAAGAQTTLRFRLRLRRRLPLIYAAVLVLTVEPGRYFTDEFLATFVPPLHGHIPTWWWWYPLTIVPIPWLWRGWVRKSRKTTGANARERIEQMRAILGGELVE
jgi:hypothetical protein